MSTDRVARIRERLTAAFEPTSLNIIDDSHKHAGHAAAGGGGHFTVEITAAAFSGKTLLQRHRMVFAAMGDLMQTEVHALSVEAKSLEETNRS